MNGPGSLGYIVVDADGGAFHGAALVVDFRGIPVDFRYTEPIKPTKLEKILYGSALDVYLREELILGSLVKAVGVTPTLWICRDQCLVTPLKNVTRSKVVCVNPSVRNPLNATGDMEPAGELDVYFVQADSVSAPLKVTFPPGGQDGDVKSTVGVLVDAARTMEMMEPFSRIQKAFSAISAEIQTDEDK